MPVAFAANAALAASSPWYRALLLAQIAVYGLALLGLRAGLPRAVRALTVAPTYFIVSNVAFAFAVVKFFRGQTMATWQPRAG
jgi:hypothetical protein